MFKSMKFRSLLALCGAALALAIVSPSAHATAVGFPFVVTDTSGNRVSGATVAIGGVTLTAGTPATVTGYSLSTGSAVTTCSVTLVNPGSAALYAINYDAALTGDVYFPLVITKSGSTFAAITDLICSSDPTNALAASTSAASASTTGTAINTKLGTPAGASVSADILTANNGIAALPSSSTIAALLVAVGLSTTNAAKVAAFAAALNASTGAVPLPATPPSGYGGSGSGGSPVVHR